MTGAAAARPAAGGLVVLGVGNPILSDDGVGIHALAAIGRSTRLPRGVRLIDGGTAGATLLEAVAGCDGLLVLDAVDAGASPGEVLRLDLHAGLHGWRGRTAHEAGLACLLGDLLLLDAFPRRAVLLGVQPASVGLGTRLSPPVAHGLELVVRAALDELNGWARGPGESTESDNANVKPWTEGDR